MQRVRKTKRATDQEEPATETQQVQAVMSLLAKPKGDEKEIHQFQKKVADDKRAMNTLLQRRREQAERYDARRQNEMSALIAEALTKPKTTSREPMTFEPTKIASNNIYHSALKVDVGCRNMISEYDGLETTIAKLAGDHKNTVTEKWVQDIERTERLLKLGHKTAVRHVKKVLGAEVQGEETLSGETEGRGKGIGVQGELNMELLQGLRYAERGVKRMVKGLPKDGH
ncbi:hypothetical protein P171DRAFT_480685 [Karstenula rhodostoma CBS 690.94]|uniref:Uncharacterized protein n=1 Tax=Karstenula rhodostoma CBS 690.94 TaxID=1392251 RepID=A0A9P4PVD4_9PLEO|nr:hypothetical protein P171DRAFT_480685 [Karstenula rhodostoma CBS 690.94]